ncbi:MAG TPA: crosslink repair DNA glycosylase YcaQ family protein [Gaiellaceae bacterium]|nr:crosslink repair DNA glycosylase YcaQ family protein [Gaiellaceae bacterium]
MTEITRAEARRIAVRAQLLDGSATDVLSTIQRLGFLQMDPISTVAPPQYLVLWSRLGKYDRAELDRLLWDEKKLFEWNAFIWPIEDLPLLQARMRGPWGPQKRHQWAKQFLKEQAGLRRYVLRELERRGPLPSRELEHHAARANERTVWWGTRAQLTWMLELLHSRGRIAVAGRQSGQRLWDLAKRWYPETETVPMAEARRLLDEKRFRALGVRLEKGRFVAHPDAVDSRVGTRVTFLSPFDRLVHDRNRAEALWDFFYRLEMYVPKAKREYGYYVLPILHGDRIIGRIEPAYDRKTGVLQVKGVFAEPGAPAGAGPGIARTVRSLAKWLGATEISYGGRIPPVWGDSLYG